MTSREGGGEDGGEGGQWCCIDGTDRGNCLIFRLTLEIY